MSFDPYILERMTATRLNELRVVTRTALAQDSRVNELGIQVTLVGTRVFVTGIVATDERRHGVALVIAEQFPDLELQNDVTVQHVGAKPVRETLS
jgi:hypothetical protein